VLLKRVFILMIAVALFATACAEDTADQFGDSVSSLDAAVGTEIKANGVVGLTCIPSRADPVGVWVGIRLDSIDIGTDAVVLGLQSTDARFGSHPSGCRDPQILLADSVFMVEGSSDPIFASSQAVIDGVTLLEFELTESATDYDVVFVPTFAYELKNGDRQTTVFGNIGRYSID